MRQTPPLFLSALLLVGCHRDHTAEELQKLLAATKQKEVVSPYPPLDPKLFPPVTLASTQPALPETGWQPLDSRRGELDFGSVTLDFIPRSALWRFRLATESTPEATAKPGQNHSYVKVSLWMGEKDTGGHVGLRAVKVDFKRKGGAWCDQGFSNGLFPDGNPRPFRITISGNYIDYLATVEDLGGEAPVPTRVAPPATQP